jgi:hypothetical protein
MAALPTPAPEPYLFGAYGLRLRGVEEARALLVPARKHWPALELVACVGPSPEEPEQVTDEHAELTTRTGGRIAIDRGRRRAVFTLPEPVSAAALVHPYLAPAAAVVSRWLGRESFHAGAFVLDGAAWAVLGERASGKSSTVAALALRGHEVLCDDMLVLDDAAVLAGPRSVDLRPDAAKAIGAGERLGVIGSRERWRLSLPASASRPKLRGLVFLEWGEQVEAAPLPASLCLAGLLHYRGVRLSSPDPALLLELAALPAWQLRRPLGWESLDPALDLLLGRLAP